MKSLSYRQQQLRSIVSGETSRYSLFRLISWAVRLFEGRIYAFLVGWGGCHIGRGFTIIGSKYISVGKGSSFGRYAWIDAVHQYMDNSYEPKIKIGKNFAASQRLHLSAIVSVEIGDNCLFGSGVYVSDHNHGSYKGVIQSLPGVPPSQRNLSFGGGVIIGSNVWLGDNVVILGGVEIGDGAIIGANTVVTRNVEANTIVAGNPLRTIKRFNDRTAVWERLDA